MLTAIGQYVGAKVVTAVLVVSSAGAVLWFWKHPETLEQIWHVIKDALVWIGVVLALPWASFFVTTWAVAKDSNRAAALMLLGYVLADFLLAWWLMGGLRGHNALTWGVVLLGLLSAAVYNFKVCEFQADRLEDA